MSKYDVHVVVYKEHDDNKTQTSEEVMKRVKKLQEYAEENELKIAIIIDKFIGHDRKLDKKLLELIK